MSQNRYTFFTIFFLVALLVLTSVAWKDYLDTSEVNEIRIF